MGSIQRSSSGEEDEMTVLVTGFGPFKAEYPVNPSWEIAASLPDYVPPEKARQMPGIRIVTPPEAVRVSYDVVRETVPSFWDDGDDEKKKKKNESNSNSSNNKKFDFVIHIGMALPQRIYQIERRGHRDHYRLPDVDGKLLGDEARHEKEGEDWIWHGVPHELLTDLDIEGIYDTWVERSPKLENTQMRISENPGYYLCDFIYFSSLAHLWKQGRERKVIFFHVPAFSDDETVGVGRELCLQLIRSIAESEVKMKQREQREENAEATGA